MKLKPPEPTSTRVSISEFGEDALHFQLTRDLVGVVVLGAELAEEILRQDSALSIALSPNQFNTHTHTD